MDRAEALNAALDALLDGRLADLPAGFEDLGPLLTEGQALARHRLGHGEARPTFVLGLEAQLVNDLRLQAPAGNAMPPRRVGRLLGIAALGLVVVLGAARIEPLRHFAAPVRETAMAVAIALAPGGTGRVQRLLADGWHQLSVAADDDRDDGARRQALQRAVVRYGQAIAAADGEAVDERVRGQARAEVRVVMARLAQEARGLPPRERAAWTAARGSLGRLLVADARVVHVPPGPVVAPDESVRMVPAPPAAPSAEPAAPTPTPEAWPTATATERTPPAEAPTALPEPATAQPIASASPTDAPSSPPATPERAHPPATATRTAPTPEPTVPPAIAPSPTADRWPTATPVAPVEPPAPSDPPATSEPSPAP